jgi:hypothetical protein
MNVRRLHPFEYQLYQNFVGELHENINIIFEQPTTNVILAAFDGDVIIGSTHIDTVKNEVLAVNSDQFDLALTMAQNWCRQHNIENPTYKLLTSVLES